MKLKLPQIERKLILNRFPFKMFVIHQTLLIEYDDDMPG